MGHKGLGSGHSIRTHLSECVVGAIRNADFYSSNIYIYMCVLTQRSVAFSKHVMMLVAAYQYAVSQAANRQCREADMTIIIIC